MGKIITFLVGWFVKKGLWGFALKALAVTYYLSLVVMASSFFYMLDYFIRKIREIISFTTTYNGGSELLSKMFAAFNLSGISQAVNDVSALISASLVFLLSRILIVFVNRMYLAHFNLLDKTLKNLGFTRK